MMPDFQFVGFDPSDELVKKANAALDRLLDVAPYGTMAIALLQKEETGYRCAVELYSKSGPFIARGNHETAEGALEHVARMLSKKLDRWRYAARFVVLQPKAC